MRIWENNEWKIVFCIRYDHFKYQVIIFGLSNILASFQKYINQLLPKRLKILVIVYIDNILVDTKDCAQPQVDEIC